MAKRRVFMLAALLFTMRLSVAESHSPGQPEPVPARNGSFTLHGLLWCPQGHRPFSRRPA